MYTKCTTMSMLSYLVLALEPTLAARQALRGGAFTATRNRILDQVQVSCTYNIIPFPFQEVDPASCTCIYYWPWNSSAYYDITCRGCEECATIENTPQNETSQDNITLPSTINDIFASQSRIVNGDFTEDMVGWYTDTWASYPAPVFLWHDSIGINASGGVMIQNLEPNDSRIYQLVDGLVTGKQYRVTGELKLQSYSWEEGQPRECGASLSVITSFYDHSMPCINEDTNDEWQSVEMIFTASGERETIGCRLGHFSSNVKGILFCDHIEIEEVVDPSNEDVEALDEVFICGVPTRHATLSVTDYHSIEQDLCIEYTEGPQRGSTVCMNTGKGDWFPGSSCSPMTINGDDVCQSCHYGSCGQPIYDCSDHPEGEVFDFCEDVVPDGASPFVAFRNDGTFSLDLTGSCNTGASTRPEDYDHTLPEDDDHKMSLLEKVIGIAILIVIILCCGFCGDKGYCGNLTHNLGACLCCALKVFVCVLAVATMDDDSHHTRYYY